MGFYFLFFTAVMAEETCTFTSRTYSVGDVFYPRLGQRGALHCVACVCQEVGSRYTDPIGPDVSFHVSNMNIKV